MIQPRTTRSKRPKKAARNQVTKRCSLAESIAALNALDGLSPQAAAVRDLLKSWLEDESGYDEETWPKLKKALERDRKHRGARSLFDG